MNKMKRTQQSEDEDSVNNSSEYLASFSNERTDDKKKKDTSPELDLATKENQAILRLRCVVLNALLLSGIAVTVVLFLSTRKAQIKDFELQFEGVSGILMDRFTGIVTDRLPAIGSLAIAATAYGMDHNRKWPFVTVTSFPERAAAAREHSHGLYIELAPLVEEKSRVDWEVYSYWDEDMWLKKAIHYDSILPDVMQEKGVPLKEDPGSLNPGYMFYVDEREGNLPTLDKGPGPYLPVWQISPLLEYKVNENLLRNEERAHEVSACIQNATVIFGDMHMFPKGGMFAASPDVRFYSKVLSAYYNQSVDYQGDPMTHIHIPVFDSFGQNRTVSAVLAILINWGIFFEQALPPYTSPTTLVLEQSCPKDGHRSTFYTYNVRGRDVERVGEGDLHETDFSYMERVGSYRTLKNIADGTNVGIPLDQQHEGECYYKLHVYPTSEFYHTYVTKGPIYLTLIMGGVFVFTLLVFLFYDRLVERRQNLVMTTAKQSTALVSSLFPKNVRDRLMGGEVDKKGQYVASKQKIKSFLNGDATTDDQLGKQQIADLFPHATVFFADIAGFTAWSSTRDPEQVFTLLQTIYKAFDDLAARRKVFKVETIGDSYVAVTGLPEPQEKHAVIMAKFAFDCLVNMDLVVNELEKSLGPDTADLSMRIGMHSGPVTAGVLRGQNCRFQIFGDTVNTAARMESTGTRGKIQISQSTAELLIEAGKIHWMKPRDDAVHAKGKGVLKTWWLAFEPKNGMSNNSETGQDYDVIDHEASKHDRLINWITEILKEHIQQILIKRKAMGLRMADSGSISDPIPANQIPMDEVVESINLPLFDPKAAARADKNQEPVDLDPQVKTELQDLVTEIASTYRDYPFHNFEHACHVTMSVQKFLKRIAKPNADILDGGKVAAELHNYTHGINSDPLTLFAIVFSALIHDVDHTGVSNAQLIKENKGLATFYHNKSVAEQNSLSVAWEILMSGDYDNLVHCLFANQAEVLRFRQVVVNIILATDIFDKDYNTLRKARWEKAFGEYSEEEFDGNRNNFKATVVMEHIIQASDVSHTMQHWHIYQKWNKCLLKETYHAFKAGRLATDPSINWYEGELSFFDNYIIPLAKKLKDCNVFGVAGDECLNYAKQNRSEWEDKGQQIVKDTMAELSVKVLGIAGEFG